MGLWGIGLDGGAVLAYNYSYGNESAVCFPFNYKGRAFQWVTNSTLMSMI